MQEHMEGSRHLEDAVRALDLDRAAEDLDAQLPDAVTRHTAKTLLKRPGLRVVMITLKKGARIPTHQTDRDLSLQVLRGRVTLEVSGRTLALAEGQLASVAGGLAHDLEAQEDARVLLTLGGGG